jgi:hypothetical protein
LWHTADKHVTLKVCYKQRADINCLLNEGSISISVATELKTPPDHPVLNELSATGMPASPLYIS